MFLHFKTFLAENVRKLLINFYYIFQLKIIYLKHFFNVDNFLKYLKIKICINLSLQI